jgi:hypothetical protein
MKKLIYIITVFAFVSPISGWAQRIGNLQGIYYQAVAIDEDGKEIVGLDIDNQPLNAKAIGVRFTITKGLNGAIQWEETHTTNTDKNGLFNLIIGKGAATGRGGFTKMLDIPWIDADQFLKVEIATKNDGNYKLVSNQQFMSVPYSFYTDDIADNAITTEKILDSTILNRDISTNAIDSRTILQETIQAEDIDTGAVTSSEILDSTILNRDLATAAVDTRVIRDSTILNRDLATASVDSRVLQDSTILNRDLATAAVDTRVIQDSTILNRDIRTGSVDSRTILDLGIRNEDIADSTIQLETKVTGVLPVANGGTGSPFFAANSLLVGGADSIITALGQATNGQIPVGVTGGAPKLKVLAGRNGIDLVETADSLIITTGVTGFFSVLIENIDVGVIPVNQNWFSPPIQLPGVQFGSLVYGTLDADLAGAQISTYIIGPNQIGISIYNSTNNVVFIGEDRKLRVLVMN